MTEQYYKSLFEQVMRTSNRYSEDLMEWGSEKDCYVYDTNAKCFHRIYDGLHSSKGKQ